MVSTTRQRAWACPPSWHPPPRRRAATPAPQRHPRHPVPPTPAPPRRFHLPSEEACTKLGISLTVLKRVCRKYGISR